MLETIRSWVNRYSLRQELIAAAGVIFFLVGIVSSNATVKVIALVLCAAAVAYTLVTVWRRRPQVQPAGAEQGSSVTLEEQEPEMKKLVFDDYQPSAGKYRVDVVEEPSVRGHAGAARPARAPAVSEYEFQLADFFDVNEDLYVREGGPKSEFGFLMKKVLAVVKDVNFAHTVAFFWVNREKNQIVLESFISDSDKFMTHRRRELGADVISQVALSGQPSILNQINAAGQAEILGYYEGIEPVRTFIAVPIFYSKTQSVPREPVAVLTIDCIDEDAYGLETLGLLGQFTKLISALIKSYTDKYDLLLDSEVLRSISRMRDQLRLEFSLHNIVRTLCEEGSRLVAWDYISVVLFDENRKTWAVQFVMNRMNDAYVSPTQEVDPQQSLVGGVIQTGMPRVYDSLEGIELPRFYKAERVDAKGALMLLPIISMNRCYGVLAVESKDLKTYSDAEVRLLQKLVETAALGLEILSLTDVVNNYVLMDETTGVATRRYFISRVQEEVQRANDFGTDLTVVMLSIDSMNEHMQRYGKEGFDFVLQNVGRMIKSSIRSYDLVGRYDFNRFAVLLVSTPANEANLWAEKLRKNIASNIINVDQKSFSVTASIGVCGAVSQTSDIELLENASQTLKKAVEAGGNVVRVF
ncbi:MAG: diguanylate cyclase [Ignavibacteria bacterium]|nr:diguanylate cyclase [Ignavibacteria bacterium]